MRSTHRSPLTYIGRRTGLFFASHSLIEWSEFCLIILGPCIDTFRFYSAQVPYAKVFEIRAPETKWMYVCLSSLRDCCFSIELFSGRSFVRTSTGDIVASDMIGGCETYSPRKRGLGRCIDFDKDAVDEGSLCGIDMLTPELLVIGVKSNGVLFSNMRGETYELRIERRLKRALVCGE